MARFGQLRIRQSTNWDAFRFLYTWSASPCRSGPGTHALVVSQGALPNNGTHPATYAQFSASACDEDGAHPPWADSGHDCAFKTGVESPWVLTAMKLYAQHGRPRAMGAPGNLDTKYGSGEDSLRGDARGGGPVAKSGP